MIKSIQPVTCTGAGTRYVVGEIPVGFLVPVGSIKDNGQEWPDHTDWFYEIRDESGNLMAELVNCPVEVKYSTESEG